MSGPSFTNSRLSRESYLKNWTRDRDLLVNAARTHLERRVPTCPLWTVGDLCTHVANVYEHKTWILALGRFPTNDEFVLERSARETQDPLERVTRWSEELQRQLSERPLDSWASTFMDDDQNVEFWFRRMALETLVHRCDAQLASGPISDMDPELSDDGVDELLWFWLDEHPDPDNRWRGQSVVVRSARSSWTITLESNGPSIVGRDTSDAVAVIQGASGDLLLHVSGRAITTVQQSGDQDALDVMREGFETFQ